MRNTLVQGYFAYGSNMDVARVRARAMPFLSVTAAQLPGYALVFDKVAHSHAGEAHANIEPRLNGVVEGVLYELAEPDAILVMDRFEQTPINYSREVVRVVAADGLRDAWTYFANPARRQTGRAPGRAYLAHLLAGGPFVSEAYLAFLRSHRCTNDGDADD